MEEGDLGGFLVAPPGSTLETFYLVGEPWEAAAAAFVRDNTPEEQILMLPPEALNSKVVLNVRRYLDGAAVVVMSPLWALLGLPSDG